MKEEWKWCPRCKLYTDRDAKCCPRYGEKEGHTLQIKELTEIGVKRLYNKGRLLTKHVAVMERKLQKVKRPT